MEHLYANRITILYLTLSLGMITWVLHYSAVEQFEAVSELDYVSKQSMISIKKHFNGLICIMDSVITTYFVPYWFLGLFANSIFLFFRCTCVLSFTLFIADILTIHNRTKQIKALYLNMIPLLFGAIVINYIIFY